MAEFAASLGVATRGLLAAITGFSVLSMLTASGFNRPFEATVGFLLSRPWTYLTAGFVEYHPIQLALGVVGLTFSCRYFEPIWGLRETVKFILIVNTATVLLTNVTVLGEYIISQQNEDLLYKTYSGGLFGLVGGFLVAFKQAVPEHSLNIMNAISIRVKTVPSLAIALLAVLYIVRLAHVTTFMLFYGVVVSWMYIRFYKYHDGLMGDRSESFSFSSFFPASTHRVIIPISNSTFNMFVSLKLLPKPSPVLPQNNVGVEDGAQIRTYSPKPLPGSDALESERRRALALKALDQRMKEGNLSPVSAGSNLAVPNSEQSAGRSRSTSSGSSNSRFGAVETSPTKESE